MATEDGADPFAGLQARGEYIEAGRKDVVPAQAGTAGITAPTITAPAFAGATDVDKALLAALDAAEPAASAAVADERFTDAMAALASPCAPIDAFFDGVMVNDPDEAVRAYRPACSRDLPARCMALLISRRSRADAPAIHEL